MLALIALSFAQDLNFGVTPAPGPGETPAFFLTPTRSAKTIFIACDVGGKHVETTKKDVKEMAQVRFDFPRNESVTSAECFVRASFVDGDVVEQTVPVEWAWRLPLSIDLSRARADLQEKTVTVKVSTRVENAEIVAFGAHKAELGRKTIPIGAGPGEIAIPFEGDPAELVILDVTLRTASAWAGFTYSPWFLDIPHDDVLFASDSDVIAADEEWKLQKVQVQLEDVVDKYGGMVPIKLYVAGCTDTVGDGGHNAELSSRRAKAIARWLKGHGFNYPIYYHGFGEGLLAVQTGDGVDMQVNRRALYMVGANPPPAGSGIPSVGWSAL